MTAPTESPLHGSGHRVAQWHHRHLRQSPGAVRQHAQSMRATACPKYAGITPPSDSLPAAFESAPPYDSLPKASESAAVSCGLEGGGGRW